MEIAEDNAHIFLGFPPRGSIGEVVPRLKGRSAGETFPGLAEVQGELWDGDFWEDGYFVRTAGGKVT